MVSRRYFREVCGAWWRKCTPDFSVMSEKWPGTFGAGGLGVWAAMVSVARRKKTVDARQWTGRRVGLEAADSLRE
jgi:hypothetical protein